MNTAMQASITRMVNETLDKAVDPDFAQGARCGHLEGKDRVGQYVLDEEIEISWDAATYQNLESTTRTRRWADGYQHGYKKAAEGSELEWQYARIP